jgi:hypothetical protein
MSEREDYADQPVRRLRGRSGCVVAYFREWRDRLPALSFGFAAGLAVGVVLYLEVGAGHINFSDGGGEGFQVWAFGNIVHRTVYPDGTGVTAAEVVWRCLAAAAPVIGAAAAAVGTAAAVDALDRHFGRGRDV